MQKRKREDGVNLDGLVKVILGLIRIAIAVAVFAYLFTKRDAILQLFQDSEKVVVNPPVSMSFRVSHFGASNGGLVMTLANMSGQNTVAIEIFRGETGRLSPKFYLKPNEQREFGLWQIDSNFHQGQAGYVVVEGYRRKLHYECGAGGKYRVWFDF